MAELSAVENAAHELIDTPEIRHARRQVASWAALADQLDAAYAVPYMVSNHALAHLIRQLDQMGALD